MIVYPTGWRRVGWRISAEKIAGQILRILEGIPCNCLSLSGGIDSSLLLYFMLKIHPEVKVFTIGLSDDHPDIKYAEMIVDKIVQPHYPKAMITHKMYIPQAEKIKKEQLPGKSLGDTAVRMFYKFVNIFTDGIIAGDGIDEFMAGYYTHQKDPNEKTYYYFIRQLTKDHLIPLDGNSGKVKVYLPFLDSRLISMLSQIPLSEKVDPHHRKKLMVEMAKGRLPEEIITRRKYGFCDAFTIKGVIK